MEVLYTSQYHFYMFWIDKTTRDCLVIVLSIRCLKKQWTLSICFGEIIVGHAVQTSLNLVTLLMLAATSLCGLLHFEETQTHVLYDKLWYCVFGLCFFFFPPPLWSSHRWVTHITVWRSFVHSSLCTCKIKLPSNVSSNCGLRGCGVCLPVWGSWVLWPFQTFTQMPSSKKMAADSLVKSTKRPLRVIIGEILNSSRHAIGWWDIGNILRFKFGFDIDACVSDSFWACLTCFLFSVSSPPPFSPPSQWEATASSDSTLPGATHPPHIPPK